MRYFSATGIIDSKTSPIVLLLPLVPLDKDELVLNNRHGNKTVVTKASGEAKETGFLVGDQIIALNGIDCTAAPSEAVGAACRSDVPPTATILRRKISTFCPCIEDYPFNQRTSVPTESTAARPVGAEAKMSAIESQAEGAGGAGYNNEVSARVPAQPPSDVYQVVRALTAILDPTRKELNLEAARMYDSQVQSGMDPQMACTNMVNALGADDSPLVRLLKFTTQGVVLAAKGAILDKIGTEQHLMTKDVRSADGWQVAITVIDSVVMIRHVRREQSLDLWEDASNHFEYTFEVACTFDTKLERIFATDLRILDLTLADTMESELRRTLTSAFTTGLLILE